MRKSPSLYLGLLAVTVLVTGCFRVGPDFCPPSPPAQMEWTAAGDTRIIQPDDPPITWWDAFGDPNLSCMVRVALQQNLGLHTAYWRILEARYLWLVAIGQQFPQFQEGFGSAAKAQLSHFTPNITPAADLNFSQYQLGFQTLWELDVWGKYSRGVSAAQAQVCATVADYQDVLVLLASEVASTYVRLRTVQERIGITVRNIATQQRSLEIAQARFDAGLVTELDVQQARSLMTDTQSRLPVLEAQETQLRNALAVLLGVPPADSKRYLQQQGTIPEACDTVVASIPAELLMRRPDIRRAYYTAKNQSERIGITYADLFPRLSLSGSFGVESSGEVRFSGGNLLSSDAFKYTYGADFAWPILNYGRIINRARAESARFCQALLQYEESILRAYEDVETALTFFVKTQDQAAFLGESAQAAQRAVDLSNTQYVEGLADYTRVLNTQQVQLQEEDRHAQARGDIALSLIRTYKALGGGWQICQ